MVVWKRGGCGVLVWEGEAVGKVDEAVVMGEGCTAETLWGEEDKLWR